MKNKRENWNRLGDLRKAYKHNLFEFLITRRLKDEEDKKKAKENTNRASYMRNKIKDNFAKWKPDLIHGASILNELYVTPLGKGEAYLEFKPKGDYNESFLELLSVFTDTQFRDYTHDRRTTRNRDSVL